MSRVPAIGYLGKGLSPTQIQMTMSIYLIKQLKIYFQISYFMKLLQWMTEMSWIKSQVKHLINKKKCCEQKTISKITEAINIL